MARGVDDEVGLDRDGVDAGQFARQGVDRRPVHHDAADAVALADDHVGELGHVLHLRTGVAGGLDERGAGVRAVGDVEVLALVARLVGHVEFVEDGLGGVADGDLVHQEPAEPEPAAEVVVLLDDHRLHAPFGELPRGHQPRGAAADDDDLALAEVHELVAPLLTDGARYLRFADVAETVELLHTT